MWYRDFDSVALAFQRDIHRMKLKTAADTSDWAAPVLCAGGYESVGCPPFSSGAA